MLRFFTALAVLISSGTTLHAKVRHALSAGLNFSNLSVLGNAYEKREESLQGFWAEASLVLGKNSRWRHSLLATTSLEGDYQSVGAKTSYHFNPFYHTQKLLSDDIQLTLVPKWSAYASVGFMVTRAQFSMTKANGTGTDVVLGALYGPTLHLGYMYVFTSEWTVSADLFTHFQTSDQLTSQAVGGALGLMFFY